MNNYANFDPGSLNPNNLARQAGQQPPQPSQMNGLSGVTQWPNVGAQSDMNILWEYIVKLSEMHEQIRAQTQQVTSGMQQIESLRSGNAGSSGGSSAPHVNGVVNGVPSASTDSAEVARLQHELLSAHSKIEDLTATITTLQNLNTDYENAISHTLDKLRPFTQSHAQALLAQKAHYLNLLEQERHQNLELRMEQSRWQQKAKEVKDMLVEAMKLQSQSEIGYVKKIAALKADNRSLRRICGVPLMDDSDDDSDDSPDRLLARDSARQSPQQGRSEAEGVAQGEERRITIH
ncbi:hypothetical protein, variant [Verruconis gallopava]|uniref:Uncharacterized protein n=1 Tax=Verruconis gallopava TaxID=253628 RepID=A0A0D2A0V9_9PEZI|nr:uncharacterized protein PV09_08192 [Verruconis gallopava]XP_016210173.1 hypothetical protein, variant [Verruconis gallopava]KIW00303.1 hypothetical protein PV09_08192 [Verruconis gallopava]KIW00304.1 hypothetical protein, variant [Verruconis gallopava]